MDQYENTKHTWDQLAQRYQDVFMDLTMYDESYDFLCSTLKHNETQLLELACGPGNITKYLLKKRPDFKIHATDVAPSMVALAQQNNPAATFEVIDCRNISTIKQQFNAIVVGFCLPYLAENDAVKLIQDSSLLLYEGGLLYISMIEGDYKQSKMETSSDGKHSMQVYYYSEEFIRNTFLSNNFVKLKTFRIPYVKGNGEESTHLIFVARKS